ncbi:MAG: hypothetical protein ACLTSX_14395 [Collinsella sp.]
MSALASGPFDELPKFLSGAVGKPSRAYVLSSDDIDPVHIETVRRALVDGGFSAVVRCVAASDALAGPRPHLRSMPSLPRPVSPPRT